MRLTLACASASMTNTFFANLAESVSAMARTSVDLPTPPLVFITAIVLRIALHSSSGVSSHDVNVPAQCGIPPAIPSVAEEFLEQVCLFLSGYFFSWLRFPSIAVTALPDRRGVFSEK